MSRAAKPCHLQIVPCDAYMFVGDARGLTLIIRRRQVRAEVEGLHVMVAILFEVFAVDGSGALRLGVSLLRADGEDSLKLIELGGGLCDIDVMRVSNRGKRGGVAAQGAIVSWSVSHGVGDWGRTTKGDLGGREGKTEVRDWP